VCVGVCGSSCTPQITRHNITCVHMRAYVCVSVWECVGVCGSVWEYLEACVSSCTPENSQRNIICVRMCA